MNEVALKDKEPDTQDADEVKASGEGVGMTGVWPGPAALALSELVSGSLVLSLGWVVGRRPWSCRWRVTVRPTTGSWPGSGTRSMRSKRPLMNSKSKHPKVAPAPVLASLHPHTCSLLAQDPVLSLPCVTPPTRQDLAA